MLLKFKSKHLRVWVRSFWSVLITALILVAVCVQLTRELFPLLNDYREDVAEWLGDALGVEVSIGHFSATFDGLRPKIYLQNLHMETGQGETILHAGKASAELNILSSMLQWRLAWGEMELHDFAAAFEQTQNGRWQPKGLESRPSSTTKFTIDDPFDLFLFGRRVDLVNTKLQFFFRVGHTTEISIPKITLENDADFHRLSANFGIDGDTNAFKLVIEATGDPRNPESFDASGYLALQRFPLERAMAALGMDKLSHEQWQAGQTLDLALWFKGTSYKGVNFRGEMDTKGSAMAISDKIVLPTATQAQFTGHWHRQEGWQVQLLNTLVDWEDVDAPQFNLAVSGGLDRPITLAVDELSLAAWLQVAYQLDLAKGKLARTLQTLNPQGLLRNVHFESRPRTPERFKLSANLSDVSVVAYQGAPALTHVNGHVEATAQRGTVTLDSADGFSMYYPKIYPEPMTYDKAKGQVTWQVKAEENIVYVDSGLLQLDGEDGRARGYLKLTLPTKKGAIEPTMTLMIGLQDSHARHARKYVPTIIDDGLYEWLMASLGEGDIAKSAFLYNGSIALKPTLPRSIQLYAALENGDLKFDKRWPLLRAIEGQLLLDNDDLWIDIDRAKLLGNQLDTVSVTLVDNPHGEGRALSVKANMQGLAKDSIELLRKTPIRDAIGSALDPWFVTGNVIGDVSILIPLRSGVSGSSQEVNVTLSDMSLAMDNLNLEFKNIDGRIQYSTQDGLRAKAIDGNFWGRPVHAHITTERDAKNNRQTVIAFDGTATVKDLEAWTKRPELLFAEGEFQADGRLLIPWAASDPSSRIQLEMETDLDGVTIALPRPYAKLPHERKNLQLKSSFAKDYHYGFLYDKQTQVVIQGEYGKEKTAICVGIQTGKNPQQCQLESGVIHVEGQLSEFELSSWQEIHKRYNSFLQTSQHSEQNKESGKTQLSMISRVDLIIDQFRVRDFKLNKLSVSGEFVEQSTQLSLSNELLQGDMTLFNSGQPAELKLDYIRLPKIETAPDPKQKKTSAKAQRQSYLVSLDLANIQAFDFSTDELTIGEQNLGSMAFDVRPEDDRIVLSGIKVDVAGLFFSGMNEGEGADLIWHKNKNGGYSELSGRIKAGDLAHTLAYWDQPKILENKSASFNVVLNWAGAPDQVSLNTLTGRVNVNIEEGRFVRGAEAGNNPLLRFIALFNFDTLARRLRLDFSDLYKGGLSFDRVYGDLYFDKGKVLLPEPMVVQSPTSNLQLGGEIDIEKERLDGSLVATLPVAGNLAVVAAFVGGLPAALGVYVVGKLLKKQVDKVSSITYSVTGPWKSPKIKVKKVFDNQGAKKAGLKARKNQVERTKLPDLVQENIQQSQGTLEIP